MLNVATSARSKPLAASKQIRTWAQSLSSRYRTAAATATTITHKHCFATLTPTACSQHDIQQLSMELREALDKVSELEEHNHAQQRRLSAHEEIAEVTADAHDLQQRLHDRMEARTSASSACSEVSGQVVSLEAELAALTQKELELKHNKEQIQRRLLREEACNDLLCLGWNAKIVFKDLQAQFHGRLREKEEQYDRSQNELAEMTKKHAELQASIRALQSQIFPMEEQMKEFVVSQLAKSRQLEEQLAQAQQRCTCLTFPSLFARLEC